jgi:hypothetical protein
MLMLCKGCGWVEQPKARSTASKTATKGFLMGLKMAIWMLAGVLSLFGYYLKAMGGVMFAFGIATAIFGVGFILAAIGWLIMQIANIFLFLGRTVRAVTGGGGGVTKCPSCGGADLIPTHTPVGRKLMAELGIDPPVEPENELLWWQRGLAYAGGAFLAFVLLVVIPSQVFKAKPKPPEPVVAAPSAEPAPPKRGAGKGKGHKAKTKTPTESGPESN